MVQITRGATGGKKLTSFREPSANLLQRSESRSSFAKSSSAFNSENHRHGPVLTNIRRPQSAAPLIHRGCCQFQSQDLCLACFKRADKNEFANWSRERSARSRAANRTLEHGSLLRNKQTEENDKKKITEIRNNAVADAIFNRGIAEAKRQINSQKPPFQKMFLLQNRPHTAQVYMGVGEKHGRDLRSQISERNRRIERDNKERFLSDVMQQKQLRRQLSAQRREEKMADIAAKNNMREHLNHQIATRDPYLPLAPGRQVAIFGEEEESETARKQKARALADEQLDLAIMKRQNELIEELMSEYEQQRLICNAKEQLREENVEKQRQRKRIQQHLDSEWQQQMMVKQAREQAEILHLSQPGGACLMEQCCEYHRCSQCFKRLNNRGKTNLLKDSSGFAAGSRFMV